MTYIVTCTLCAFECEIEELEDVFEFRDTHQDNYGDGHVIEFELLEQEGLPTD